MDVQQQGIILNCENFDACVSFYTELFELPVMFRKTEGNFQLCCLQFGNGYLMVETGGKANPAGKSIAECPLKLRFNVDDLPTALQRIRDYGIEAQITEADWGNTINIYDPDGNRIGIRDTATFG